MWPEATVSRPAKSMTAMPQRAIGRHTSRASVSPMPPALAARTIHQVEIPATMVAARSTAEVTTWNTANHMVELPTTEKKARAPFKVARPFSGSKTAPTGCCIQELAPIIHSIEVFVPAMTSQATTTCAFLEILPQPKIQTPKNVDSMKKDKRASKARGAPKISPTKREYSDQPMPNWNSWTIPVATPRAKFTRNSFPKNRVAFSQYSLPVRYHIVSISATSKDMPMVNGTRKKW